MEFCLARGNKETGMSCEFPANSCGLLSRIESYFTPLHKRPARRVSHCCFWGGLDHTDYFTDDTKMETEPLHRRARLPEKLCEVSRRTPGYYRTTRIFWAADCDLLRASSTSTPVATTTPKRRPTCASGLPNNRTSVPGVANAASTPQKPKPSPS